jgi:hypothetical protein
LALLAENASDRRTRLDDRNLAQVRAMSGARFHAVRAAGFDAIALENDHLRAVVVPELGGRVWTLEDLARRRQWIWHRDGVPLAPSKPGASYDDVWAGGWEELFPNDASGRFEGRDLPDHGEWWTLAWEADTHIDAGVARLRLTATSQIIKAECIKEFTLRADQPSLVASYQIRSLESEPFHFLFKQHLPVQLNPSCRLTLPGGRVEAVDPSFGTLGSDSEPFHWPINAAGADLSAVPSPESKAREFVYINDLKDGWCGVDDHAAGASLRMEFDRRSMPFVWFFLSYGGWRDTNTAVLEPCTNLPKDLTSAVNRGQSARLEPGQMFSTSVTVRLSAFHRNE